MLGRGTFSTPNRILPGIYVRCNFKKSTGKSNSIRLYANKGSDGIILTLTNPFYFNYEDDGNGTISLSHTYGYSLFTKTDGEGTVLIGASSKW